jgi:hypothetical protein
MPLLEELIETKTLEIKRAMSALGRRLEAGDESQLLVWVIPGNLACAHRPLDIMTSSSLRRQRHQLGAVG